MTKQQAVKQAREFIKENKEYDPITQTWKPYKRPLGSDRRHDLKNRRIIYVLMQLGVNEQAAKEYAYTHDNLPFRDAIYKFKK